MLIDTHAHLNNLKDTEEVVRESIESDVTEIISVSTDIHSSIDNVKIANKFNQIFSAVGIHPCDIKTLELDDLDKIESLCTDTRNKAIGEIGLDFYYSRDNSKKQLAFFDRQIEIAENKNLPFIVHSRDSYKEVATFLKKRKPETNFVIHCFTGNKEDAKVFLDLGSCISFTGIITFKKSNELREVVDYIPTDRIMIETDSPYLSPEPKRGKENHPMNLVYIAECLSLIKKEEYSKISEKIRNNTIEFFKL